MPTETVKAAPKPRQTAAQKKAAEERLAAAPGSRWPSDPKACVAAKLAYVQGKTGQVEKTGVHQQGYTYMQEHKLIEQLKGLLREVNASIAPGLIQECLIVDKKIGAKEGKLITIVSSVVFRCGDTGGEIAIGTIGSGEDMSDKGAGKAATYAFKYGLQKGGLIPTDQIDDADQTVSEAPQASAPAQAKGAAPAAQAAPAEGAGVPVDQAKALVQAITDFVKGGSLDPNKVKAKLGTFRTDDVAQLTPEQFEDFRTWLNAEVAAKSS